MLFRSFPYPFPGTATDAILGTGADHPGSSGKAAQFVAHNRSRWPTIGGEAGAGYLCLLNDAEGEADASDLKLDPSPLLPPSLPMSGSG